MSTLLAFQYRDKVVVGSDSAVCVLNKDGETTTRVKENYFDKMFVCKNSIFFIGGRVDFTERLKSFIRESDYVSDTLIRDKAISLKEELKIKDEEIITIIIYTNIEGRIENFCLDSRNNFSLDKNVITDDDVEIQSFGFNKDKILNKAINKYYQHTEGKVTKIDKVIKESFNSIVSPEVGGVLKLCILSCVGNNATNISFNYYLLDDKYNVASKEELVRDLNKYVEGDDIG